MQQAQQWQHAGQDEAALAQLIQALPVVHQLVRSPYLLVQPDDCLAAWVVTHLWITDLLAAHQQLPAALDYLCDAHEQLLQLESQATSPQLQEAAWRHQRETLLDLLLWQREHGSSPRIQALLKASVAGCSATHSADAARPNHTNGRATLH